MAERVELINEWALHNVSYACVYCSHDFSLPTLLVKSYVSDLRSAAKRLATPYPPRRKKLRSALVGASLSGTPRLILASCVLADTE